LNEKSAAVASSVIMQFREDCEEMIIDTYGVDSVKKWAQYLHTETKLTTSTIWSYLSHANAWFEFGLKMIVKDNDPTIKRLLKLWEKNDDVKKAAIFTLDEINTFLREGSNENTDIVVKVALIIGGFGLLRLNELVDITWECLEFKEDLVLVTIFRYNCEIPYCYL